MQGVKTGHLKVTSFVHRSWNVDCRRFGACPDSIEIDIRFELIVSTWIHVNYLTQMAINVDSRCVSLCFGIEVTNKVFGHGIVDVFFGDVVQFTRLETDFGVLNNEWSLNRQRLPRPSLHGPVNRFRFDALPIWVLIVDQRLRRRPNVHKSKQLIVWRVCCDYLHDFRVFCGCLELRV